MQRAVLGETDRDWMMQTGTLPGDRPFTAIQEIQADRAALELLARAGYAMEPLVEVWHGLAETTRPPCRWPSSIRRARSAGRRPRTSCVGSAA